jgi:sulfur carrier protein
MSGRDYTTENVGEVKRCPPRDLTLLGDNVRHSRATVNYRCVTITNGGITARSRRITDDQRKTIGRATVPTIVMRIPKRQEIALDGRRQVSEALRELGIAPETVLVIKGNRLLTRDAWIEAEDVVEVRPVMSGGC